LKYNYLETRKYRSNPILSATFCRKIRTNGLCVLYVSGAGLKGGFG
jgi:hypothetical protein